jgi:hypothetical protein
MGAARSSLVMPRWLGGDENTGLRRRLERSSRVGRVSGRRHTPTPFPTPWRHPAAASPPATHRLVVCREERARVAAHAGRQRHKRPASVDAANEWGHDEGPGCCVRQPPTRPGVVRLPRGAGAGSALSAPYSLRPNSLDARRGRLLASRVRFACRTVVQLTAAQQYGSKVGLLRPKWTVRQRAIDRDRSSARAIMVLASARIRFSASESGFHP